ncbi:Wadjet anti-phage system protein JetD domain-containing protein [Geobacter anodireducens]
MNQCSRQLLTKLLDAWQGSSVSNRTVRLPITRARAPQYFAVTVMEEKEALHAGLQEAAAAGVVSLEWGKGYDAHILRRINLVDGPALARYLGVPLAATQADSARSILTSELSGKEEWISNFVQYLLGRWSCNKKAVGLKPGDTNSARMLVRALEAVSVGRHRNLDLRTFSTREFGDSKVMEGMLSRFGAVWKRYNPTDLSKDELFETLGLVKFPHPLLLRGSVVVQLQGRALDCEGLYPYVGLPPQSILGVSAGNAPKFVLTIENLTSFNRYTAEILDDGLVLYTSGFPSPGIADFLRLLDRAMPPSAQFFHWGDVDEGGLKIFAYIQGLIQRPLVPHLMSPDQLARYGTANCDVRVVEIAKIAHRSSTTKVLASAILSTDPPKTLEQEYLDPIAPNFFS